MLTAGTGLDPKPVKGLPAGLFGTDGVPGLPAGLFGTYGVPKDGLKGAFIGRAGEHSTASAKHKSKTVRLSLALAPLLLFFSFWVFQDCWICC